MQLVGNRTYAVCVVIIALAACQRFLGLAVPQELWIVLFGLVGIAMRAAVSGAATLIALLLASSLALSGCVRDTYDCEPDGTSVSRTAFLWPTKLESAEFWVGTNKVFRLGNYASDGGQEAAASVAAAAVGAAMKAK